MIGVARAGLVLGALLSGALGVGAAQPLSIVAFGTSLTARQEWPTALARRLETCLSRPVKVSIVARNGVSSDWALGQVDAVLSHLPDVVLMEFAVNDSALNRFMLRSTSKANMETIMARLRRDAPHARLFVLRMGPASGPRGWIRLRRPAFENAHRQAALANGATHVDLDAIWRGVDKEQLARAMPDGLHPDPAFAAITITPALARAVGGPQCGD
jgi:hypothetical protein